MKVKILAIIMLIFCIPATLTFAQLQEELPTMPLQSKFLESKYQRQQLSTEVPVLEAAINPDEYIVGPGDGLALNIWSEANASFKLLITPEGKLLIPTVNDIDLNGLTLTEAKQKIVNAVKKKYINSEISVNLISLRKFRVTVSGQVENPGAVIVSAADRVSDAIKLANIPTTSIEQEKKQQPNVETVSGKKAPIPVIVKHEPSKRHIILTRKNGKEIPVDLLGYEITGDKSKNPYLLEGDVIYVPRYTKNLPTVEILGAVHQGGVFELMEGDRVMDLVKLAHGFTYNADPSNIEISRFNSDNKTTTSFKVDLSKDLATDGGIKNNVLLNVDDRIYVRYIPEYHRKHTVEIKGEVKYPGFYTIEYSKTRLSDIVKAAGGFTENASLKEAFVIRRIYEDVVDLEYERLSTMKVEEMTELEREYYKIKSRERKGRVAVDFVKLFIEKDSTKDIILHREDYIEIPPKDKIVIVSGQVGQPGLISFKEGEKLDYYIKNSGGYSWNANRRKVRIIRAETGEWIKPNRNTVLYIGDTILVPEKSEKDYWLIFKDVLSATVQIATLVLVIQNATRK